MNDQDVSIESLFGDTYPNLTRKIVAGKYVSEEQIATARRDYPDENPPQAFIDYAEGMARSEIRKPAGRKERLGVALLRYEVYRFRLYEETERYLRWLRRRKKRHGLRGWRLLREADWWQGAPLERALRMAMVKIGKRQKAFSIQPFAWTTARDLYYGVR